jgi:uncharacterized repeat protein (TIGR01451 family)
LLLASGSNATAGFTTSLSVSEPAGTNFSSVLLLASGSAVEDTNAPFDFTITIPWEAIGNYPVSYLAVDTYSNTWWGTNMLFVTPFAGLASLRWMEVEPRRYIFTRPNSERQITVTGVYLDVLRNITDPSTTTTYSSADTNVVTVSTNGLMRAHNNGTTQITIANNGKTAYVDVTVALLPAPDLALSQTVSATNVLANVPMTFTLRVTNIGPQTASAVYLVDAQPLDAQLQSATTSQGAWSFANGFFAAELGSLALGGSATATLTVIFTDGGAHLCIATASAVGVDANDLDNEASVVVSVNAQPVLAIRQETTNVIVSWPTNAGAFVLERTPALAPTTWNVTLTNPPASGHRYEVTIPVTNAAGYFRLRSP